VGGELQARGGEHRGAGDKQRVATSQQPDLRSIDLLQTTTFMPHASARRLGLCAFLILQSCAAPHQAAPTTNTAIARNHLLAELKGCLAAVAAENKNHFISPCIRLDVAQLSGITLAQLEAALGKPGISSDDYVSVPDHPDPSAHQPPYEARWGFYTYPVVPGSSEVTVGGGPEMQCVAPDRVTCQQVLWVHTQ
jgi:hypothetical protein